jgi:hypothetical protein
MDRRKFLRASAAAVLSSLSPHVAESRENKLAILDSDLTAEQLERHKARAVASLADHIPARKELQYVRDYSKYLGAESQMYIPLHSEIEDVERKSSAQLSAFESALRPDEHGLFIFADQDAAGNNVQRLYVLKRVKNALQFVKAYRVSTAQAGFGNSPDSSKTPLGPHVIPDSTRGILGEVVARAKKFDESGFVRVHEGGTDHWFVRGFGSVPGDDLAEVITDQYLLSGPHTSTSRGIRIHGTNRAGKVGHDGKWITFLGGRRRSGGCIRMSSTDVRDLYLSGYISTGKVPRTSQTKVYIHATDLALKGSARPTPEEERDLPPRWSAPATAEVGHRQEPSPKRQLPPDAPPRWRP